MPSVIGVLAAPAIADFYAGRLDGGDEALQRDTITFLLRLFLPQVVLYGVYFVGAGIMNAHKRFGAPMYTPILNNLVVIATGITANGERIRDLLERNVIIVTALNPVLGYEACSHIAARIFG